MKFEVGGVEAELVERLTFRQARLIEVEVGKPISQMGEVDNMQATYWVSLKLAGSTLRFRDLDDMELPDAQPEPEQAASSDEPESDPTSGLMPAPDPVSDSVPVDLEPNSAPEPSLPTTSTPSATSI